MRTSVIKRMARKERKFRYSYQVSWRIDEHITGPILS
jgi:hypothetical protein